MGAVPTTNTMAMVIDLQSAELPKLSVADARGYFDALGKDLDAMREAGIGITWETMGPDQRLIEPDPNTTATPRSQRELTEAGFYNHAPGQVDQERLAIFTQFLERHGPKANEAMHVKYFKSAFTTPEELAEKPRLKETIQGQYAPQYPVPEPGQFPGKTMTKYMQEQDPVQVLIMGGMADHCIAETAIGVAQNLSAQPTIMRNRILSWSEGVTQPGDMNNQAVWRDKSVVANPSTGWHATNAQTAINDILSNPAARDMTEREADRIGHKISISNTGAALKQHQRQSAETGVSASSFIADVGERLLQRRRERQAMASALPTGPAPPPRRVAP